ncbi:hypothetical protein ACFL6N_05295 [Thermodesulfobacteriota bacterium]
MDETEAGGKEIGMEITEIPFNKFIEIKPEKHFPHLVNSVVPLFRKSEIKFKKPAAMDLSYDIC